MTANATMAQYSAVKRVMENGLDSLKWSTNFFSKEQYVKVAGVGGKWFDVAMRNIRDAYQIREKYGY